MSLPYTLENHGNNEEKWRRERREWGNRDRGRMESTRVMKDRIKDGQVVVKEMNRREAGFSYWQLTLQMCAKMKYLTGK